jgi:predicted lipoprotein with Yx(FWY)xxD motif
MTERSLTPRRSVLLRSAGLAAAVALGAAACGGSSSGGTPADAVSPSATSTSAASTATVGTAQADLGAYLVDASGRTLYLFEADKGATSTCAGPCAAAWPPATVTGTPDATGAAKANLLGSTQRDDGTTQLTYAGHPLYRYSGDAKPGDMNGAGSEEFGAEWYPVTPSGETLESGEESGDGDGSSPEPSSTGYSYSY